MSNCITENTTPTNSDEVLCDGKFTSTQCILTPVTIPYIEVVEGESQLSINAKLVLAIQYLQQQINELTARVEILES